MKRIFLLMVVLLLSVGTASATIEKWTAGWDNFSEPLDFAHSNITWSIVAGTYDLEFDARNGPTTTVKLPLP